MDILYLGMVHSEDYQIPSHKYVAFSYFLGYTFKCCNQFCWLLFVLLIKYILKSGFSWRNRKAPSTVCSETYDYNQPPSHNYNGIVEIFSKVRFVITSGYLSTTCSISVFIIHLPWIFFLSISLFLYLPIFEDVIFMFWIKINVFF